MEDNIKYFKTDLFPTSMIKIDLSDHFTSQDQDEMIKDIDHLIDTGLYENNGCHPLYQTKIILFNDDRPKVWKKLKNSFYNACYLYLENVPEFCSKHILPTINPIDSHAWAYKSWHSLNQKQNNNPVHTHSPAFLSGVFYLNLPISDYKKGTEFFDPRSSTLATTASYVMEPSLFSWLIFPGWLPHRACLMNSEEPRYTIAANMYISIYHENGLNSK